MQAKQQVPVASAQEELVLRVAQAKAVSSAMDALRKIGVSAASLVLPATRSCARTTVFWNDEGVGVTTSGGLSECHDDPTAFAAAYGVGRELDQLLHLARRLAYPNAGERLTLDDYRNIARQIVAPDGARKV